MRTLVVDPGYSSVKWGFLVGRRMEIHKEPTILAEVPSFAQNWDSIDENDDEAFEWQGKRYLVGPPGIGGLRLEITRENLLFIVLPFYLKRLIQSTEKIFILLSLADFDLTEKIRELITEVVPGAEIKFLPQGYGAWLLSGSADAAIFDLGFNTVDVIPFRGGKPEKSLAFSLSRTGLASFLSLVRKDDPHLIARRLEAGDPELSLLLKKHYWPWLLERIRTRPEWPAISSLPFFFAGGGAYFIPGSAGKKFKKPELVNVEGVLAFLKRQAETQSEA